MRVSGNASGGVPYLRVHVNSRNFGLFDIRLDLNCLYEWEGVSTGSNSFCHRYELLESNGVDVVFGNKAELWTKEGKLLDTDYFIIVRFSNKFVFVLNTPIPL